MDFSIIYPPDYDQDEELYEIKGRCVFEVRASTRTIEIIFYDATTLFQTIEAHTDRNGFFQARFIVVVVKTDRAEIEKALTRLTQFGTLAKWLQL